MLLISFFLKEDNRFLKFTFNFFKTFILPLNDSIAYLFDNYSPVALELDTQDNGREENGKSKK